MRLLLPLLPRLAAHRAKAVWALVLTPLALLTACSEQPLGTGAPEHRLAPPPPGFAIQFGADSTASTPSAATSITVHRPAGVAVGDLLLAQITFLKGSDVTVTAPAGWSLVNRTNQSSNIGSAIYRKFVGASEPASYTWLFSQSVSANGGILAYRGVDPVNPVVDSAGASGTSGDRVAPTIASETGARLVAFFSQKKNTAMGDAAGMTLRYTINPSGDERQSKAFDQSGVTNPTGTRSVTGSNEWVAQSVTLRAAPSVTVNKVVVNQTAGAANDGGKFDLRVSGTTRATDVGHGGTTGQVSVSAGSVTVSEVAGTATDLDDYLTEISCNLDKGSSQGTSHTFTIASGEDVTCTITNTRKAALTIQKLLDPEDDEGRFDLQVDGETVLEEAGHEDDVTVKLAPGTYTVGEIGHGGTDLDDYISEIGGPCDEDGEITLTSGETATCTITNTRKASAPQDVVLYLHNNPTPPIGNTRMQHPLPLNSDEPTATILYNYDTDRDSFAGRLIQKGGSATTTDRVKYQTWRTGTLAEDLVLSGDVELVFWSAMKDFKTDKRGYVVAFLLDGSTVVATASLNPTANWQNGSTTWVEKTITFTGVDRTVASGRYLELRVIVHSNSHDDMWFAYDTTGFPSRLILP